MIGLSNASITGAGRHQSFAWPSSGIVSDIQSGGYSSDDMITKGSNGAPAKANQYEYDSELVTDIPPSADKDEPDNCQQVLEPSDIEKKSDSDIADSNQQVTLNADSTQQVGAPNVASNHEKEHNKTADGSSEHNLANEGLDDVQESAAFLSDQENGTTTPNILAKNLENLSIDNGETEQPGIGGSVESSVYVGTNGHSNNS